MPEFVRPQQYFIIKIKNLRLINKEQKHFKIKARALAAGLRQPPSEGGAGARHSAFSLKIEGRAEPHLSAKPAEAERHLSY